MRHISLACFTCIALATLRLTPTVSAITFTPAEDAYVQSNGAGVNDGQIRVKTDVGGAGSNFHRKGYLQYDISSRTGRRISSGQLDMTFIDTAAGGLNGTPNFDFTVHGLTNQALDGWSETTINYANAPGNDASDGNVMDAGSTSPLAAFSVTGKGLGAQSVSNTSLGDFLTDDVNGLATLAVTRDTVGDGSVGTYVHAFQSKESAGAGATLSIVEDNALVNGEFEDAGGSFDLTGWTNNSGVASAHAPLADGSAAGAFLDSSVGGTADLQQSLSLATEEFMFDVFFATTDGGGGAGDRGLNLHLGHPGSGQINLRVNGQGQVQVFDSGWQTLTELNGLVAFSEDNNGDNNFTSAGDVLNVHHLRILGHDYGTPGANYDVLLSGPNSNLFAAQSSGVQFWQNNPPDTLAEGIIDLVRFEAEFGNGDFAVDAAYLQDNTRVVPEPAAAALTVVAALALSRRRRMI